MNPTSPQNPRQHRRRSLLFVVVPVIVTCALTVAFLIAALNQGNATGGAALGSPVEGAASDAAFWLGAGMVVAAATALANWRLPRLRTTSSVVGAFAVLAAVSFAV